MYCSTKGYYLSLFSSNLQVQFFYFKTSHVIVYQRSNQQCSKKLDISKHLMLLFIEIKRGLCRKKIFISKHLMLLFIHIDIMQKNPNCIISKHLMLLFIVSATVTFPPPNAFQNISCYCLSNREILFRAKKVFQNISCYCLSGTALRWHDRTLISKHLMLLFICHISLEANMADTISKHLMLLFIHRYQEQSGSREQFQNISCYCLSLPPLETGIALRDFKTSHVIVYLFLQARIIPDGNFKTSHVIVYLQPPDQQHSFHHHFKTSHVIVYLGRQGGYTDGNRFQNISCYCLSQELRQRAVM